jgi:hypothetical protein
MSSIQYVIKTYNSNQDPDSTFENKFYITIDLNSTYLDVLNQMITELKQYNFKFDTSDMVLFLAKNENPRETYIFLERVT